MISKGRVFVTHNQLKDLFNLPDDVEIISAENFGEGFEFKIASKEPIGKLTQEFPNWDNLRRTRVPREVVNQSPIFYDAEEVLNGCKCGNPSGQRFRMGSYGTRYSMCADCSMPIEMVRHGK